MSCINDIINTYKKYLDSFVLSTDPIQIRSNLSLLQRSLS